MWIEGSGLAQILVIADLDSGGPSIVVSDLTDLDLKTLPTSIRERGTCP
jgi:hypothetical protein